MIHPAFQNNDTQKQMDFLPDKSITVLQLQQIKISLPLSFFILFHEFVKSKL